MRPLAMLLLMFVTAAAPAPPRAAGMIDPVATLAPDSATQWVPFGLTLGNQIHFVMMLDGKPVRAILDTGLSFSVLSRAYVDAARMKVVQSGAATAIGGVIPIGWTATARLSFGGFSRTGGEITVAQIPSIASGGADPVDILIGADLLAGYALDIDYDAKRFRLLPSGELPFRGASAPLSLSPTHHLYLTQVTLNGHDLQPIVVDSGDGSMLTLSTRAWQSAEPQPPATTTAIAYGLGGTVVSQLAILPDISLGDLVARRIEVRVEPPGGFSDSVDAAGRLGSSFLQRYRVMLDPTAGRIVLSPGATADTPPIRSTSGLLLGFDKDRLRVMHVMRGGPAAVAGWRAGETICRVDGAAIPPDYADTALAGWSVGKPGRVVTLGMCDGSARRLTLADFY